MEHNENNKDQPEELEVTSGSHVREERIAGRIVEMPSGYFFRLRPTPLDMIVKMGKLPDGLVSVAASVLMGEGDEEPRQPNLKEIKEYLKFYELVTTLAMVDPKVVENPTEENELAIEDIEFQDRMYISRLLYQPLRELEPFRKKQESDVEPVHPDENLVEASVGDAKDEPVGG